MEPSNPDLHIAKGSILSKKRKHQEALQHFHKAQNLLENPIDAYPFIAFEYQCLGRFQDAINYLENFLNNEPDDDIAIFNIAYCFERLDAYNDAIDFFKQLIEKSPYCEITWYQLGLFYNKIKDYKQAIIALDYAILIDETLQQVTTKRLAVYHNYEEIKKQLTHTYLLLHSKMLLATHTLK
ncbi:MAG: hypothetical protein CM15mP23_20760 [Cryomorphaceae bacterium]|nr:MAG: hypothetical protein CM15mP23_20760 [Cryomorphaceae bacterium]